MVAHRWHWEEHINPLEGRATLMMLLWRARKVKNIGTKFPHLLDSQVNIGVLTKKRSSSYVMNFVSTKFCSIELAAFLFPFFLFVRSERNPSDRPSRW